MISVKIERKADFIVRYTVSGHSGYAEEGSDIVCAAVSAIAQTAVLGLKKLGANPKMRRKSGFLEVTVPVPQDETLFLKAGAVLETAVLGLTDIEEGYPAFVRVED